MVVSLQLLLVCGRQCSKVVRSWDRESDDFNSNTTFCYIPAV